MAKSSGKSAAPRKRHGRAERPIAAKQAPRTKAKPRSARKRTSVGAAPAPEAYFIVTETTCVETPDDDFDPDGEPDNLIEDDD